MTRETVYDAILKSANKNLLLQLPTSFGKSKIAIDIAKKYNANNILIVVPRNVLKENWKNELDKWWSDRKANIIFTTYVSLEKHCDSYDIIIFDEAHHLTERCLQALSSFIWKKAVLLSATITRDKKLELSNVFTDYRLFNVSQRQAIDSDILPDPRIILIPLVLDNSRYTEKLIINSKGKNPIECKYEDRFTFGKYRKVIAKCTQRQYYSEISKTIEFYKKKAMSNNIFLKRKWLFECGKRLKWLSSLKTEMLMNIANYLKDYRTLIFCNSIEQTEVVSPHNCINSKNKDSKKTLESFNNGDINTITAVDMLNEGISLVNCQIGVFGVINSSQIMQIQKSGRLQRHQNPILIIPYYMGTREEEIVDKMLENYNPQLIERVDNISDIKVW